MSRVYVCLSILPTQAEEIGPSLHTYMGPCRFKNRRFEMYVSFSSACVVEMGYALARPLREARFSYNHL